MGIASADPSSGRPVAIVLARLQAVRRAGSGWVARCPSHHDRQPSLSISEADDGAALIFCHAGCPTEAIVAALDLTLADLYAAHMPAPARIVATYEYQSAGGQPLHRVVRYEPKGFRQQRWTGTKCAWGLRGIEPVLYLLPELVATQEGDLVTVVEGERDADRLAALGFIATTNLGGAGKWRAEYGEWLRGRDVVIIGDNDEVGRTHVLSVAKAMLGVAARVRVVELPGLGAKGDVSDWLDSGETRDSLLDLIASTAAWTPPVLGAGGASEPSPVDPPVPAPAELSFPTLAATLEALVAHLMRFIHFARPEHADAVALWVAHTHAELELLEQSPILAVTSAVKQSGKTRLLDLIEHVVRRPWRVIRPSEAVLFRKIDTDHPTVLLDEIDAIFNDRSGTTEGIRTLFNSGNRQNTPVARAVPQGRGFGLVEFDVFCPKATAGIGGLPETILDRAIVIPMERRAQGERVERLRDRDARALGRPLRDALAFHVAPITDFVIADAQLPAELDERAQDGWEPLIAIAEAAGGDWPAIARQAARTIFAARRPTEDSLEMRLLGDVGQVFGLANADFVATAELREGLLALEESPWGDIRGKPITASYIAKVLGRFDVHSARHRPLGSGNPVRGYFRADLADAWRRYLGPEAGTAGTSGTADDPARGEPRADVPDVPDVPDAQTGGLWPWQVPGDPDEWVATA